MRLNVPHTESHLAPKLGADLVAALAHLKGDNLAAGAGASANEPAQLALRPANTHRGIAVPRFEAAAGHRALSGPAQASLRAACACQAPNEERRFGGCETYGRSRHAPPFFCRPDLTWPPSLSRALVSRAPRT